MRLTKQEIQEGLSRNGQLNDLQFHALRQVKTKGWRHYLIGIEVSDLQLAIFKEVKNVHLERPFVGWRRKYKERIDRLLSDEEASVKRAKEVHQDLDRQFELALSKN